MRAAEPGIGPNPFRFTPDVFSRFTPSEDGFPITNVENDGKVFPDTITANGRMVCTAWNAYRKLEDVTGYGRGRPHPTYGKL